MNSIKTMRQEVKKYIDVADDKIVQMMHAILQVEANVDWWNCMSDKVKEDVEIALGESERGEVLPHEEIQKRYEKWLVK